MSRKLNMLRTDPLSYVSMASKKELDAAKFKWEVLPSKHGRGYVGMVYRTDNEGKWLEAFFRDDSQLVVENLCELQTSSLKLAWSSDVLSGGKRRGTTAVEIHAPEESKF